MVAAPLVALLDVALRVRVENVEQRDLVALVRDNLGARLGGLFFLVARRLNVGFHREH
jgi:hypothetical protein